MRTEPIFDTYSLVKRISKAGIAEDVAQEIVHAISEGRSFDYNLLATKPDIALLKQEVDNIKENMATKADVATLKQEVDNIKENMATHADLNALKQEMKAEINQVKYDILKWMIPLMMTIIALIISNKFY
jgi:hypothetical protein